MTLSGIFPMLVTPFDEAGNVVLDDFTPLITAMLNAGVPGLATLGLGAEAALLSADERLAVTDRVLDIAVGVPVIVGATSEDTASSCQYAEHAAQRGAAAVMVAPSSEVGSAQSALKRHYLAVADAIAPVSLMVQDAPTFIGVSLDAPLIAELVRSRPNIRYAKTEAVPAGEAVHQLAAVRALGTTIFGGQAGLHAIDVLDAGAAGLIPGCESARELVELARAYRSGDRESAVRLQHRLLPLLSFMFQSLPFYLQCTKTLLWARGLISSPTTRIDGALSDWSRNALDRHAKEAGVA